MRRRETAQKKLPRREHALLRGSLSNWSQLTHQGITSCVVAMCHCKTWPQIVRGQIVRCLGRGAVAPGNACIQMIDFISSCVRFRVLAKLSIASLTHSSKDTSHLRTSDTPWTPEKTSGLRAVGGSLPSQRSFAEFSRRRRISIIPTSVTPRCSFVLSVTGPIHT